MALGWYVQKNNVTVKEDRGSYWQKKSPSAAADRTAPTDRGSAAVRWGKFCVYGSSWDIWHDIHKYTVYIEVKRRQREKREKQSEEKAGQREMSVLSGQRKPVLSEREESICVCVLGVRWWGEWVAMPSLRKCFQDGVHLFCHGCQRELKLLLRRRRGKEDEEEGEEERTQGRKRKDKSFTVWPSGMAFQNDWQLPTLPLMCLATV